MFFRAEEIHPTKRLFTKCTELSTMFLSNCRKERYNSNQASTEISSIKTAQNARVFPLRKNNREANTIAVIHNR